MNKTQATQHLLDANIPNAVNEARWLADHAQATGADLAELIQRRLAGEPLAYITQSQPFMAHDFTVQKGVLIPREDTAILVKAAVNYLKDIPKPTILEVGVGSGIIACTLLKEHPSAIVHGTDISETAMACCTQNAEQLNVKGRLSLYQQSTLRGLPKGVDLIISNPPYIEESTLETLEPHVKNHEPHVALSGGEDGLDCYCWLIPAAFAHLKPQGKMMIEIGFNQRHSVSALCEQAGFIDIICQKDTANKDRVILAQKS